MNRVPDLDIPERLLDGDVRLPTAQDRRAGRQPERRSRQRRGRGPIARKDVDESPVLPAWIDTWYPADLGNLHAEAGHVIMVPPGFSAIGHDTSSYKNLEVTLETE